MAIGMIFEGKGVTRQQYEQVKQAVMPNAEMPTGMRYHAAGPSDDGWNVMEIWDSEADARRFFLDSLEKEMKRAGITAQPRLIHLQSLIERPVPGRASTPDYGVETPRGA